jgi:hypothetical protein
MEIYLYGNLPVWESICRIYLPRDAPGVQLLTCTLSTVPVPVLLVLRLFLFRRLTYEVVS